MNEILKQDIKVLNGPDSLKLVYESNPQAQTVHLQWTYTETDLHINTALEEMFHHWAETKFPRLDDNATDYIHLRINSVYAPHKENKHILQFGDGDSYFMGALGIQTQITGNIQGVKLERKKYFSVIFMEAGTEKSTSMLLQKIIADTEKYINKQLRVTKIP